MGPRLGSLPKWFKPDVSGRSLGWMLSREAAPGVQGGILADGIGYGRWASPVVSRA